MSQLKDWFPSEDAKLVLFAENYSANIDEATEKAKLPKGTFDTSKESVDNYLGLYAQVAEADKETARLRKQLVEAERTMEASVRAVAKQFKNTVDIAPEVLAMLELVGTPVDTLSKVAAQAPTLVMSVELGVVKGRYTKHSHQAIDLYGCRTGEKEFTLLGRYTLSRFEDRRPNRVPGQPEQRDYYAVFVDRDQHVGQQSPTVSVVVGSRPGSDV